MNFVRNPLGSVGVNPFTESYPASHTSTPLQGSNTIPPFPVNLESDVEHSVQDINSPKKCTSCSKTKEIEGTKLYSSRRHTPLYYMVAN
jgi:hypothetical protein